MADMSAIYISGGIEYINRFKELTTMNHREVLVKNIKKRVKIGRGYLLIYDRKFLKKNKREIMGFLSDCEATFSVLRYFKIDDLKDWMGDPLSPINLFENGFF